MEYVFIPHGHPTSIWRPLYQSGTIYLGGKVNTWSTYTGQTNAPSNVREVRMFEGKYKEIK